MFSPLRTTPKYVPTTSTVSNCLDQLSHAQERPTREGKQFTSWSKYYSYVFTTFSWLYRIRPSVLHEPFQPMDSGNITNDFTRFKPNPNQLRWHPFDIPTTPTDFIEVSRVGLCRLVEWTVISPLLHAGVGYSMWCWESTYSQWSGCTCVYLQQEYDRQVFL